MGDRTRNEGDPPPDPMTERMQPPALPGYGQPPPPPAPPMSTAPVMPPAAGTPGWTGPVSAQPAWTQPAGSSTTYVVTQPGVSGLAKLGALVLIIFGLFWTLVGGALLLIGRALTDADIPALQETIVVNGEVVSLAELAVSIAAGIGVVILVLAILEVLVGIFAWRGSGFARFIGTVYALIFGIPVLLAALGGSSSRDVGGSTTNTTSGVVVLLVIGIAYLYVAIVFMFRWKSRPS